LPSDDHVHAASRRLMALCGEAVLEAVASVARKGGWAVSAPANPVRAVAECAVEPPQALVLDMDLSAAVGMDALALLRELAPEAFILVLHSSSHRRRAAAALGRGADAALGQPFYAAELDALLARCRGAASLADEPSPGATGFESLARETGLLLSGAVAGILGRLEMNRARGGDARPAARDETTRAETARIGEVASDLLALAEARHAPRTEVVLDEVAAELADVPREAGVSLETALDAPELVVRCNAGVVRRALRGLLRRALAVAAGGKVRLETRPGATGGLDIVVRTIPERRRGGDADAAPGDEAGCPALVETLLGTQGARVEAGEEPGGGTVYRVTFAAAGRRSEVVLGQT